MGIVSGSQGGSGVGPSCVLSRGAALDIRTVASHPILWDALYDNMFDFNPLAAIPAGLGLTFVFDGTAATLTTTAAGTWAFSYSLVRVDDATWFGALNTGIVSHIWTPTQLIITLVASLATSTALAPAINTTVLATANPYTTTQCDVSIVRLA